MDADDERAAEAALRSGRSPRSAPRERPSMQRSPSSRQRAMACDPRRRTARHRRSTTTGTSRPTTWSASSSEVLFSHPELKDGDHIVFAWPDVSPRFRPRSFDGHEWSAQIFRNITVLGRRRSHEGDHLCRGGLRLRSPLLRVSARRPSPTPITYSGPEHPVVHFSGLTFRNDHLTRGRNAMVCAARRRRRRHGRPPGCTLTTSRWQAPEHAGGGKFRRRCTRASPSLTPTTALAWDYRCWSSHYD